MATTRHYGCNEALFQTHFLLPDLPNPWEGSAGGVPAPSDLPTSALLEVVHLFCPWQTTPTASTLPTYLSLKQATSQPFPFLAGSAHPKMVTTSQGAEAAPPPAQDSTGGGGAARPCDLCGCEAQLLQHRHRQEVFKLLLHPLLRAHLRVALSKDDEQWVLPHDHDDPALSPLRPDLPVLSDAAAVDRALQALAVLERHNVPLGFACEQCWKVSAR